MHTMIEEVSVVTGYVELNESSNEKIYYIQGPFSTIGVKNRNGRIYPRHIWEREVARYNKEVLTQNSMDSLMEAEHPTDGRLEIDILNGVAKIVELKIDGNYVMGKARILKNPKGQILESLIDVGLNIGVSSRGVGKLQGNEVFQYSLKTYDVVSSPSDYAANLTGLRESVEQQKYEELDDGSYVKVCSKDKCILEHRSVIDEAVITTFKNIFAEANEVQKLRVPSTFSNVTINDFVSVLKLFGVTDKIAKYREIVNMIEKTEDSESYITSQTIRRIAQNVRSKLYVHSDEHEPFDGADIKPKTEVPVIPQEPKFDK